LFERAVQVRVNMFLPLVGDGKTGVEIGQTLLYQSAVQIRVNAFLPLLGVGKTGDEIVHKYPPV
jgi:hypothetical protein